MRFYNSSVGLPAPAGVHARVPVGDARQRRTEDDSAREEGHINWADEVEVTEESKQDKESKQTGFVEAHIDGVGKVKIPISALANQLKGLKREDGMEDTPTESITTPADADDDTHSEPLPDYSVAMPPTRQPITKKPSQTPLPSHTQPIRHLPLRSQPFIHPADHFRSTYDASHLPHLSHLPFYPRRHVPQDFVPRHVLDRALRQYIAGTLRGRRVLEKRGVRGAAGRKRAILAGMKGGDVEAEGRESTLTQAGEKKDDAETRAVSAKFDEKEVEVAIKKEEVEAEVRQNVEGVWEKVGVTADKAKIVPAALVELAHV